MKLQGSLVALVTPMVETGEIDWAAFERLIAWHMAEGSEGLVILGTTGEGLALTEDERKQLILKTVTCVAGRVPVIVGTGHSVTREAIRLSLEAEHCGADACLVVVPAYNKPPQRGLVAHYQAVAKAVSIPLVLYNVPSRTVCDLLPSTVAELGSDQIIGLKEAVADLARIRDLKAVCSPDFVLLSGDDLSALGAMQAGARGVISVTANVAPRAVAELCSFALAGDWDQAHKRNNPLISLHRDLFIESNPIPVKWALYRMGFLNTPMVRLPLMPLNRLDRVDLEKQQVILEALVAAGIVC
jgi:4-hydroxy-tetrahydrodipicolinate synthase